MFIKLILARVEICINAKDGNTHLYRFVDIDKPNVSFNGYNINDTILIQVILFLSVWTLHAEDWTGHSVLSCFNPWVVLSRTVQPENGDLRLNLRFVSPWNTNSPQQNVKSSTWKLEPGISLNIWTAGFWPIFSLGTRFRFSAISSIVQLHESCVWFHC